uniref:Uncharacterized protein n=1 Tax=Odontella aurita TaxID=265563 RepID=A0A7S4JHN0_9STRA
MASSKKSTSSSKTAVSFLLSPVPTGSSSQPYGTTKSDARSVSSTTSAFTPRKLDISTATPTSMMLMPPSQTISESLTALAATTASQLEEVWDEVGYNPDERASQLSDLLSAFRNLCEEKIAEERGVAETFKQTIIDSKKEMQRMAKALRRDIDDKLLDNNPGLSLTDELATIEVTLETLRADAEYSTAEICESREKIVAAHVALGSEIEPEWQDVSTDLTQERRDEFRQKVSEMYEVVATRTSATVQLLKDCQHLVKELKIDPDESVLDRQIMGSLVRDDEGTITISSHMESETCTGISSRALDDLTSRVSELNGEKRRRKARLGEMGVEIAGLWEKLKIAEDEQRAFAQSVKDLSMDTISKGESELKRLYELKSKMIGKLILESREEIRRMWEEISANEEQRSAFQHKMDISDESLFTDELLSQHENYIRSLQSRLDQMRPILRVIEKREEIVKERMEYEKLQKDPERLQQRGAALTKQLMKEEKMARRIKKDLPKYTDVLEKKLNEWRKAHGESFIFHGQKYSDVIQKQEDEWRSYKDSEMQLKLKKKQEEQTLDMDRAGERWGKPLPGRKKTIPTQGKSSNGRPFSNAVSRTNVVRAPSRGRSEQGVSKGAEQDTQRSASSGSSRMRAASRSRAPSRSRAQSTKRGVISATSKPITRP